MADRYEKIRKALAMGPTPGPWRVLEIISVLGSDMGYRSVATTDDTIICDLRDRPSGDAHLIAACDPDTIRELLAERDQLAAALEAAREDAERMKRDIAEQYDMIPMLPITGETMDAATDWFTRYCIVFHREIDQARGEGGP